MVLALMTALGLGYLAGSLPWGLWLGRAMRGVDVRTLGSKNLGATNVYRSLGPAVGVPVLLLDIAKGALPTWLVPGLSATAAFPGGLEWCRLAVAAAAVLGHMFTVFVATVAATRYISLGSILGSAAFAITLGLTQPHGWKSPTFVFGALLAVAVVFRHKDNIARLARGEERRFSFKRSAA